MTLAQALARNSSLVASVEHVGDTWQGLTAGKRAAAIQSLFATAKRNQLNPAAWLTDVIEKLPAWPNSRIDELLPFCRLQISATR